MDQNPHPQSTPISHRNPHNPPAENQKNKPNKMDQNPHRNRRLALSNKIDTFGGDGENEKQDRRLQRQAMAMAMARDIQPHSTLKPTDQAHSTRKQQETKEERAIGGGGNGGDGDRRKLEEERLIR